MTDIVMESAFSSQRDSTGADESAGSADHSFNQNTGESGDDSAERTGNTSAAQEKKISGFEVSFFRLKQSDPNGLVLHPKVNIPLIVDQYNSKCAAEERAEYVRKNWGKSRSHSAHRPEVEFYFAVYVQTSTGQNPLLARYQIEEKVTNHNIVVFYWNTDGIYAVTQRQGYRLIERYIDYEFPIAVARRLLDERGRIKHKSVNLYGKAMSSEEVYRKGIPTKLLDFQICVEYFARLRSDASIRSIPECFGKRDIKVNIGLGKVRFLTKIDPKYYPDIIYQLDLIHNRFNTYSTALVDNKVVPTLTEEKDSESFTNFVQKVVNYKQKELNSDLTESIRQYILGSASNDTQPMDTSAAQPMDIDGQNQVLICLDNFYVCHKDYDDFSRGTDFKLVFKERKHPFETTPTLEEVLDVLKKWIQPEWTADGKQLSVLDTKDSQSFEKNLFKVHLSYSISDKMIKDTLINCIEGEMMADQYYWRRRRIWYCILGDSLRVIHNEFIKVLKKYLMKNNESGNLMTITNAPVWGSEEKENDYAIKFKQGELKKHFFCMDSQLTNEAIELFDLMSYYKPKRFIYHIKQGLNRETRVACAQLRNSAQIISSMMRLTNSNDQNLRDYYQKIIKEYKSPENFPEFVNTFEKFKKILSDPELIFVYAIAISPPVNGSVNKSLAEEMKVKNVLKSTDLKPLYAKHKIALTESGIGNDLNSFIKDVINRLIDENYLREVGSDYEVTSKLLFSNGGQKLSLSSLNVDQNKLIRKIFSPYVSRYETVGPMMDVIHLKEEIESKEIGYPFKICEISIEPKPNVNVEQNNQ